MKLDKVLSVCATLWPVVQWWLEHRGGRSAVSHVFSVGESIHVSTANIARALCGYHIEIITRRSPLGALALEDDTVYRIFDVWGEGIEFGASARCGEYVLGRNGDEYKIVRIVALPE